MNDDQYKALPLRKEWYRKLKAAGFNDHEDESGNLRDERARHDQGYMQELTPNTPPNALADVETKQDRFAAALFRYPFASKVDRDICSDLAAGVAIKAVIETRGVGQARVYRVINSIMSWKDTGETLFGPEVPK
jgi:hypothetical protein